MNIVEVLEKPDIRTGILSHLTMTEIQDCLRGVSQEFQNLAEDYKSLVVNHLLLQTNTNPKVLVIGLQSDKGKPLNGLIGHIVVGKQEQAP